MFSSDKTDNLWPTFHDLIIAYKRCRLNKASGRSQIQFETHLAKNLSLLLNEIHCNHYIPSPAKCFIVTYPKPREIFAADFKDRVIHHLVVSQLEPIWEKKFIDSSFACRLGKGTHGALRYIEKRVREISQGGNKPVWALQLDIEKFFVSINRPILCNLLSRHCHHPKLNTLVQAIYSHDARQGVKRIGNPSLFKLIPAGKSWFEQSSIQGIPIGNLTSQFGANAYLTGLDHFILRALKPQAYLRYMDDLLLLDLDPEKLQAMPLPIDQWLISNRNQQLNQSKTHLAKLSNGITHLGYRLQQINSASRPLQVFSEPIKQWKWITSLRKFELNAQKYPQYRKPHQLSPHLLDKNVASEISSINARLGTLHHCKSYLLRKTSLERFIKNMTSPNNIPEEFVDCWCPFSLKKDYRAIRLK
ncbi:MAG: hypothetical protein HQK50_18765 [Oligoflexia bacterium]|nr:hypothetical protein [Oligoflexia bacterium]